MIEPNWNEAPPDATHWDNLRGNWCNEHGFYHDGKFWEFNHDTWGTGRYIPLPEKGKDMSDCMTHEEEKIPAEDWIEDAPTRSDQAEEMLGTRINISREERMYHQRSQFDTKNYSAPNATTAYDEVNSPKHYQIAPDVQAIDIIKASLTPEQYRGYLLGNLLKYRLRAGEKGDAAKDLAKSDWYKRKLNG